MAGILLKVCGMKFKDNIEAVSTVEPTYMGFIFYQKSARYARQILDPQHLNNLSKAIVKVGVFVNSSTVEIDIICTEYGIKTIQLHGDELPEQCLELKQKGYKVIKAFSMVSGFDFLSLEPYIHACDFFLFDTKGENYGGTGRSFDWEILRDYNNALPFFISGGIDGNNLEKLKSLTGLNIHAVDINSKFEIEPGLKEVSKIKLFKEQLDALNSYKS